MKNLPQSPPRSPALAFTVLGTAMVLGACGVPGASREATGVFEGAGQPMALMSEGPGAGHSFRLSGHPDRTGHSRTVEYHLSNPDPEGEDYRPAPPVRRENPTLAQVAEANVEIESESEVASDSVSGFSSKFVEPALGKFNSFTVFEKQGQEWKIKAGAGQYVPITRHGSPVTVGNDADDTCDRPALLGTDKQCAPYTVVGRVRGSNPEVQWLYLVRKYRNKTPQDPDFNQSKDVAIIGHHPRTGATVFYQMYGTFKDARKVPSPMTDAADADRFWNSLGSISSINCPSCHSADPFIHSPYLQQVQLPDGESIVPSDPLGPYYFVGSGPGEPFDSWGTPRHLVSTARDNYCTHCHRIGAQDRAHLVGKSTMNAEQPHVDPPRHRWMAPVDDHHFTDTDGIIPEELWNRAYGPSASELYYWLQPSDPHNPRPGQRPAGVTAKAVENPEDREIVVDRTGVDRQHTDVYLVDSRMRANADGRVSSWSFWSRNGADSRLVVYEMVGASGPRWKLRIVAESEKVPNVRVGKNEHRLQTPIPIKAGYYFGLRLSGSGGLGIPYTDDSAWAQADNPSPVNPDPLGTIVMLSENAPRIGADRTLEFGNFVYRTYSFELEDDLN